MMKTKLLLLLTAVLLSSCMTLNKAKRKLAENPIELAKMCALHFPATDKFIKGDPVISIVETTRTDTVTIELDGKVIKVPCPECKSKKETITVTDTIIRLDEASLAVLLNQVNELSIKEAVLKNKVEVERKRGNKYFWIMVALGALLGIGALLRFK